MTKLEKVQAEKEQALILLTQVVETYTLRDKGKIQGAYVYSRELLDERINKFFERLGFKNVEWKNTSNINYSYWSILYRDDDTDIFLMMTYFDIKIKTWDADERPMEKLSKDDIEMIVYRVREDLAESGSMDTQGETHLLTFENGGLTSK